MPQAYCLIVNSYLFSNGTFTGCNLLNCSPLGTFCLSLQILHDRINFFQLKKQQQKRCWTVAAEWDAAALNNTDSAPLFQVVAELCTWEHFCFLLWDAKHHLCFAVVAYFQPSVIASYLHMLSHCIQTYTFCWTLELCSPLVKLIMFSAVWYSAKPLLTTLEPSNPDLPPRRPEEII